MPIYLPFIPLFIWFGPIPIVIHIVEGLTADLRDWQSIYIDHLIFCIGAIITIAVIIFLARATFARRLKGFGLNAKTIHKDFLAAPVFLLSIWPLLFVMIELTTYFGKSIWGHDYEMPQHGELQKITTYPQLPLQILIIITAVLVGPVLEEALFRGLFQTMIRSYLEQKTEDRRQKTEASSILHYPSSIIGRGTWLSIVISSIIFTMIHQNPAHWPALFVLALCLGYSYEKSGSLLRPIFIHCLFNAITITAVLTQNQ